MIRLNVIAEGETEQTFVLGYLSQHLASRNIICTSTLPGRRGGDIRYPRFKRELLRLMSHDQTSFFSCMIDYFALNNEFPGFDEAQSIIDAHDRVIFLEEALAQDINQQKFIPYIQLHEFEALVFTDMGAGKSTITSDQ